MRCILHTTNVIQVGREIMGELLKQVISFTVKVLNLMLVLLGQSTSTSQFVVEERDELIARLQETERKLREKTSRVSELEQNLEEVGLTMFYCTSHLLLLGLWLYAKESSMVWLRAKHFTPCKYLFYAELVTTLITHLFVFQKCSCVICGGVIRVSSR